MNLSIVTVTYNSENFIGRFLDSVIKNLPPESEIVVVDSGSEDDTVGVLKKYQNKIKIIESKQNIGYGKGNNLGAKEAKGDYILILNPDIKVIDSAIAKLLDFIKQHPAAGIVAPKLIQPDGKTQPSVRKLPTISRAIFEYYLGQ